MIFGREDRYSITK